MTRTRVLSRPQFGLILMTKRRLTRGRPMGAIGPDLAFSDLGNILGMSLEKPCTPVKFDARVSAFRRSAPDAPLRLARSAVRSN